MSTNAWNLMILPALFGLALGAGLGVAGLALVRLVDVLAAQPVSMAPRGVGPGGPWWSDSARSEGPERRGFDGAPDRPFGTGRHA